MQKSAELEQLVAGLTGIDCPTRQVHVHLAASEGANLDHAASRS